MVALACLMSLPAAGLAVPINIPENSWVFVPYPGVGQSVYGSSKHLRWTYRPGNHRLYHLGGDFLGAGPYPQSSRLDMFSYDVASNTWALEEPYCLGPGKLQQSGADEVGWAYDSRRDRFWMIPGYMADLSAECTSGSTFLRMVIMTWDPNTSTWNNPGTPDLSAGCGVVPGFHKFAQYDSLTDNIIVMSMDKACEYNIGTNTWTSRWQDLGSAYSIKVSQEYTAFDRQNRLIYAVDGVHGRLYSYHVDTHHWSDLGPTPYTPGKEAVTHIAWDNWNQVLLWPYEPDIIGPTPHVAVYHPDTGSWETLIPPNNTGQPVVGTGSIVFDPDQNVLVTMGCACDSYQDTGLFLYRYRNGSGSPAQPDTIPPSPPQSLHPRP